MEKKMETSLMDYMGHILGLYRNIEYWGYTWIMEKKSGNYGDYRDYVEVI